MGDLTVYQIAADIAILVALITGILYLTSQIKSLLDKTLDHKFKEINKRITDIDTNIEQLNMDICKNFIVRFLADVENGEQIFDAEKQRFYEEYKYYTDHDGNSYIKEWYRRLKEKGYL